MAMQAVKDHINDKLFIGTSRANGIVVYRPATQEENLSTLKWLQENVKGAEGEVIYVGKTKLTPTNWGYYLSLEKVDMSKVTINEEELAPYIKKDLKSKWKS